MPITTPSPAEQQAVRTAAVAGTEGRPALGLSAQIAQQAEYLEAAARENWLEALRRMAKPKVDTGTLAVAAEQFGTEYNPDGTKNRTGDSLQRFEDSRRQIELSSTIAEEGIDSKNIDATGRAGIVLQVIKRLENHPDLAEMFSKMNPADKDAYVMRLLRDPGIAKNVAQICEFLQDPKNNNIGGEIVKRLQDEARAADLELQIVDGRYKNVADRKRDLSDELKDKYDRSDSDKKKWGEAAKRIVELEAESPVLKATIPHLEAQVVQLSEQLVQAEGKIGSGGLRDRITGAISGNPNIVEIKTKLTAAQKELAEATQKLRELDTLTQREKNLNTQIGELTNQGMELWSARERAALKAQADNRNLQAALDIHETQEVSLASKFDNIITEAATRVVEGQLETITDVQRKDVEETKAHAKDQASIDLEEQCGAQWDTMENRKRGGFFGIGARWEKVPIPNKAEIDESWTLFGEQGPRAVMIDLLRKRGYNDVQIDKLMLDKTYVSEHLPRIMRQLTVRRARVHGVAPEELAVLLDKPWGKEVVEQVFTASKDLRNYVTKYYGEGILNGPDGAHKFLYEAKKNPFLILLLLLGSAAAIAALGPIAGAGVLGGGLALRGANAAIDAHEMPASEMLKVEAALRG